MGDRPGWQLGLTIVYRRGRGTSIPFILPTAAPPPPRFERVATLLAAADAKHSITFGLVEAEPADDLEDLLARTDADLLQARHSQARDSDRGNA
jgi:hypothetical protein